VERRSQSYERLAFLGDSVLGLAVTTHLWPRLAADTHGAGQLTKIRAQAVSGRSCRAVAERLRLPERLRATAPEDVRGPASMQLAHTERVLASVIEAVIGACYLTFGYDETAEAVVEAFQPRSRAPGLAGRLQVGAAGAARAPRLRGHLHRHGRGGPAARAGVRDRGRRGGRGARARLWALEEGRRAGRGRGGRSTG
jgi:23S rRNA maturation mini-RNase III